MEPHPQTSSGAQSVSAADVASRRSAFRKLHESGCFVIPNPWDAGTARYLSSLGFKALATTSGGFAFSHGFADNDPNISPDVVLRHITDIVTAGDLPVNADFKAGYAPSPEGVAKNVSLCIATGVAGLSIEDATDDRQKPLYDLSEAVERIEAAREAIDAAGGEVLLTGRAECFLVGHPDPLRESLQRIQAYAEAGADVLFVPGIKDRKDIEAVVAAAHPKPVNVLVSSNTGLTVADLAGLGVRRISVGSALARIAWGAFLRAAQEISGKGSFTEFNNAIPFADLNGFFEKSLTGDQRGK